MYFFYVDESGNPHAHHNPLANGETPLFALTAVAIHSSHWRGFSQDYAMLKERFFRKELRNRRPQYYEIKGNTLLSPRNKQSSRRVVFTHKVMDLILSYGGRIFSTVFIKSASSPASKVSLYTHGLQVLCERLHAFLDEVGDPSIQGLMMLDGRLKQLDEQVARSHLSFIFGHQEGRQFTKLVEAPVFVDSKLSAGIQLADVAGAMIYAVHYHEFCSTLSNALDYSHALRFKPRIQEAAWQSTERYNGYHMFGIRVIRHDL